MCEPRRVIVAMLDGFGLDYFRPEDMPALSRMAASGLSLRVKSLFPSVTNVNNVSIATGAWPDEHGVAGNSVYDRASGRAVYLNSPRAIRVPTALERASRAGRRTALLTSKRKTKELFAGRADYSVAAEALEPEDLELFGPAPGIYTAEVNWWLWRAAERLIRFRPEYGFVYVHTTDYPMHAWAPEDPRSREHLRGIDSVFGEIAELDPKAAFFVTADHGMNAKTRCWDLVKVCEARGLGLEFSLSPERDYYEAHHRNFCGCAWLWLKRPSDREAVRATILGLRGVEAVEDSSVAARRHRLDPACLGDLVVYGDQDTMFGELGTELETIAPGYRAHGSLHEMDVPLIIYNYNGCCGILPPASEIRYNKDLCAALFR